MLPPNQKQDGNKGMLQPLPQELYEIPQASAPQAPFYSYCEDTGYSVDENIAQQNYNQDDQNIFKGQKQKSIPSRVELQVNKSQQSQILSQINMQEIIKQQINSGNIQLEAGKIYRFTVRAPQLSNLAIQNPDGELYLGIPNQSQQTELQNLQEEQQESSEQEVTYLFTYDQEQDEIFQIYTHCDDQLRSRLDSLDSLFQRKCNNQSEEQYDQQLGRDQNQIENCQKASGAQRNVNLQQQQHQSNDLRTDFDLKAKLDQMDKQLQQRYSSTKYY